MTPLVRVIDFLKAKGFRDAQQPFGIGSATFEFDAVLIRRQDPEPRHPPRYHGRFDQGLLRELLAFGRSLDALGSRRTLTLVLVGKRIDADVAEDLSEICRLLMVSATADDTQLRDSLAVLLPLELPPTTDLQGDWSVEARNARIRRHQSGRRNLPRRRRTGRGRGPPRTAPTD